MTQQGADRNVAVTGARGRLGRAIMTASAEPMQGWDRPLFDLEEPASVARLVEQEQPSLVIHCAAMTAVDEAARQPEVAMRRNGSSVGALAAACRMADAQLLLISSNEVFSGERDDGRGYVEDDDTDPRNPYGRSKLTGEIAAQQAFDGHAGLWIVRTAWLYGPPGDDFPDKIAAAADRLPAGEPLPVVADEIGSPTLTADLAAAVLALLERTDGGLFHLVNTGSASRFDWARRVLAARRPDRTLRAISASEFQRASEPPAWGVLDTSRAAAAGVEMRPWQEALADYLAR